MAAPNSALALDRLRVALAEFDGETRRRGTAYFKQGAVVRLHLDDTVVTAKVSGTQLYTTTLLWDEGEWSANCSCPIGIDCKHTYATGLAWLDRWTPKTTARTPVPVAAALPVKNKSFRAQWTPILEKKLGRPLADDEGRLLGALSALFSELKNGWGRIYPGQVERHGFVVSPDAVSTQTGLAYGDWWDINQPPKDPWAMWQFIAYDYERSGHAIPEAFRPMTDTAAVAAKLEEQLLKRELDTWRRAFEVSSTALANAKSEAAEVADVRLRLVPDEGLHLEVRAAPGKPWKTPTLKWVDSLATATPADFAHLTPAASALAIALASECRGYRRDLSPKHPVPVAIASRLIAYPATHGAIALPDDRPFQIEAEPLVLQAVVSTTRRDRLDLQLLTPEGRNVTGATPLVLHPEALYEIAGHIYRGPPPVPASQMPVAALAEPGFMSRIRTLGLRLPATLELRVRHVSLRPLLRCWLAEETYIGSAEQFCAQLYARSDDPPAMRHWGNGGWQWTQDGAPPPRRPDDPLIEFDLTAANAVGARFADFKLSWFHHHQAWARVMPRNFPEEFAAWRASLPPDVEIEAQGALASLLAPPLQARVDFNATAASDTRDWFDLTIELKVEDTTLTPDEISLLLKARGKWVRLPRAGWRRLELVGGGEASAVLDRLGLHAEDLLTGGRPTTHRLHALQLASEAAALDARDAALAAGLRRRAAALAATPLPEPPATLQATLRPYQREGFQFLAHLSTHGFGGVLADDMGLGKTVQTLGWLLHLAAAPRAAPTRKGRRASPRPFRALVICPKSVVHGWLGETARFAPALPAMAFTPALAGEPEPPGPPDGPALLVAHYTQLRLHAAWFQQHAWDVVVLDEAQFIKNPASKVAAVARALPAAHRLALTGTPVENRLLDLWSLVTFAQPGLLGTQTVFKRQHSDDDPAALERLRRRVRHFMLRRTKGQVATDLPPRTEDDLIVELEGEQRRLYDAELKRARAALLGVETDRALDRVRFNVLASLLRLRQICCHPALVDPAHRELPSAKLDALLERLEELRDEGHQVLVFSQFVGMLELIQERLVTAGIGYLLLTGRTEDRATLVETFQRDRSRTVFLLSLKAAGFGLNLTAASYAILYDPWWNPAVEAQAIDRTHRIGQTQPVVAYRLLASGTVEEKIRRLQRDKAALAGSIVQEESLASVLDLESLKKILA